MLGEAAESQATDSGPDVWCVAEWGLRDRLKLIKLPRMLASKKVKVENV